MNNKTNMEEDIKILENKLKQWEPYKNIKFSTEIEKEISRENKAIEHLIKAYKEIEEEKEELNIKILGNAGIYELGFNDGKKAMFKK